MLVLKTTLQRQKQVGTGEIAARGLVMSLTIAGVIVFGAVSASAAVRVVECSASGSGARAGLVTGDRITSWSTTAGDGCAPTAGRVESAVDWFFMRTEIAPRGDLVLLVESEDQAARQVEIPAGPLEIQIRPEVEEPGDALLERAVALLRGDTLDAGSITAFSTALAEIDAGDPKFQALSWWAAMAEGDAWMELGDSQKAEVSFDSAVIAAKEAGDWKAEIHARIDHCKALRRLDRIDEALDSLRLADAAIPVACRESLCRALVVDRQGENKRRSGQLAAAAELFAEALDLRRRLADGSLDVATSINGLAIIAFRSGNLVEAQKLFDQALVIRRTVDPDGLSVGQSHNNLGLVAYRMGDLAAAQDHYEQALLVKRKLAPRSMTLARSLNNIALLATTRGHFQRAERALLEALDLQQTLAPSSSAMATTLNNLGDLNLSRGDMRTARGYLERSLTIHLELNAESVGAARAHGNLGYLFAENGDLDRAEKEYRRALAIVSRVEPDGLDVAKLETNLAELADQRGDLDSAEEFFRRSLANKRRIAPASLVVASALVGVADVERRRGEFEAADKALKEAVDIASQIASGSSELASCLWSRARLWQARGEEGKALDLLSAAVDALEHQTLRAADTSTGRARFRGDAASLYRELITALVDSGQREEAFAVIERSRARGLAELLAQRDLVFSADLPADLERSWRMAEVAVDRVREELAELSLDEVDEVERLTVALREAQQAREAVETIVGTSAPQLMAFVDPEPLSVEEALENLDDGTVALVFSIGSDGGHLFVLGPGRRFATHSLDVSSSGLAREIEVFRGLINPEVDQEVLRRAGASLFQRLAGPAEVQVRAAERLVIVPDGPLHLLPFAALTMGGDDGLRFVAETTPLTTVTSLGVLSLLRRRHDPGRPSSLVAFADPQPGPDFSGPELPYSRVEAQTVAALFDGKAWVGRQATERQVINQTTDADLVHIATHAELDSRRPLESSLILSPSSGDGDDGRFHAWEVVERLRLQARMVTLSGCSTALGEGVAGEGLLGLTRAFHLAGAGTVMASLWRVQDQPTAAFMARLYWRMAQGASAAEAVQQTQAEWIRGRQLAEEDEGGALDRLSDWARGVLGDDASSAVVSDDPYVWAAFQLYGDWR